MAKIILYKGKGFISGMIRCFTWSDYTHVVWQLRDGSVIHAAANGVIQDLGPTQGSLINEKPDVYEFIVPFTDEEDVLAEEALKKGLGEKSRYDFGGLINFIIHSRDNPDKWFCSELVQYAARIAGRPFQLRIEDFKMQPAHIVMSPLLKGPIAPG